MVIHQLFTVRIVVLYEHMDLYSIIQNEMGRGASSSVIQLAISSLILPAPRTASWCPQSMVTDMDFWIRGYLHDDMEATMITMYLGWIILLGIC